MAKSFEEQLAAYGTNYQQRPPRPEPVGGDVFSPIVSVDDHLWEPPDLYEGRLPRAYEERAPRVERDGSGADHWVFEDQRAPLLGPDVAVTWEPKDYFTGATSFDDVRPGTWKPGDRVHDMDVAGIVASLNFPSGIVGFCGQRFMRMKDRELGLACMRAYNDWIIEEWVGAAPDRMIGCQVTWLADPQVAAEEVRKNAERGFRAVAFCEMPEKIDLPSIHTDHWDPLLHACAETGTVVNLHVGSSSQTTHPSSDAPPEVLDAMFPLNGYAATTDWLFARIPVRFPDLKIAISEGGIGWVPMLLDRLEHIDRRFFEHGVGNAYAGAPVTPREALHRNFWFTTYFDPSVIPQRSEIGVDRIMFEVDYPHVDSTWPASQHVLEELLTGVDPGEVEMMTCANASELYRFPIAEHVLDQVRGRRPAAVPATGDEA